MNERDIISSRRKFLKNIAYGSLLIVGGVDIANAKAKHATLHTALSSHLAPHNGRVHDTLHRHLLNKSSFKIDAHNKQDRNTASHKIDSHNQKDRNTVSHKIDTHNKLAQNSPSHKVLAFHNPHTGDQLKLAYFERGRYIREALHEINHLFRDYHDGSTHPIDLALLDQLYDLKHKLEVRKPFHIVSAYRSPATNADLRKHSDGVAKNSLHMQGRAIDIRIEGIDSRRIRNAALAMHRGGVGYYGRSDFVHLDTGSVRTWAG